MTKLTDETLNKYLDGELDSVEIFELKKILEDDEETLSRLKALRAVDNSLRKMEIESAPANFTENLMIKVANSVKIVRPRVSYFFVSVIALFSTIILALMIGFSNSGEKENSHNSVSLYTVKTREFLGNGLADFQSVFSNQNVVLVISILTLVLLVSVYLTFESHKNFKDKLNHLPN